MFLRRSLVDNIARTCSDLFFRVKTQIYSGLSWLNPVTVALERCLSEGIAVETWDTRVADASVG